MEKTENTIQPLGDTVMVERRKEDSMQGGIHIPSTHTKATNEAIVIRMGDQASRELASGTRVVVTQYPKAKITHGRTELEIFDCCDILAVMG